MTEVFITLGLVLLLMMLRVPVYIAFLFPSFFGALLYIDTPIQTVVQTMYSSLDKFALMAVPFFIFAAELMSRGGMAHRLVRLAISIVGKVKGGMAITTLITANLFGAMSGSSPATVAAMSKILHPHLEKSYGDKFSAGLITSVGGIALIIPPSIAMILYAISTNVSVGDLFIAGIIPGIVLSIFYLVYIIFYVKKNNIIESNSLEIPSFVESLKESILALGVPVLVIGGIYSGLFTPTESAAIAAIYAVIVSVFVYKDITIKELFEISISSGLLTAKIFIMVASSAFFAYFLSINQIPQEMARIISDWNLSAIQVLIIINIILLIVGMFVDTNSAILIFTPLFFPIVTLLGVDPIHFGIIVTVNLAIGMYTPPFGLNIFVSVANLKMSMARISQGLVPFIIVSLASLLVITLIPSLSTVLVNLMK